MNSGCPRGSTTTNGAELYRRMVFACLLIGMSLSLVPGVACGQEEVVKTGKTPEQKEKSNAEKRRSKIWSPIKPGAEVDAVGAPDLADGLVRELILEQVNLQQFPLSGRVFRADLAAITQDPLTVRALTPDEEVTRILAQAQCGGLGWRLLIGHLLLEDSRGPPRIQDVVDVRFGGSPIREVGRLPRSARKTVVEDTAAVSAAP